VSSAKDRSATRAKAVLKEINTIGEQLIGVGLVDVYYPATIVRDAETVRVSTAVKVDSSVLKAPSYSELYEEQSKSRSFNYRFLDGALIQMSYRFKDGKLLTHRLAYMPSPDLEPYMSNEELYIMAHQFTEVVGEQVVSVPLRFDFDVRPGVAKSVDHPASHLTLGQRMHCRIAASGPMTPAAFVDLVVQAFYSTKSGMPVRFLKSAITGFSSTITSDEREAAHLVFPAT
jgi:hypothetical protein